jgi:hypothetical protein
MFFHNTVNKEQDLESNPEISSPKPIKFAVHCEICELNKPSHEQKLNWKKREQRSLIRKYRIAGILAKLIVTLPPSFLPAYQVIHLQRTPYPQFWFLPSL